MTRRFKEPRHVRCAPCPEMAKLRRTLDGMGARWEDASDGGERPMLCRTRYRGERGDVSVIWGTGSYGGDEGLLEAWDYDGEPRGWLTAERVLAEYPPRRAK